jgi:hypothetical protein
VRRRIPAWKDRIGLTEYPSFGFERLPDPVGARAIDERGARMALWRRASPRLWIAAVAVPGLIVAATMPWHPITVIVMIVALAVLAGSVVDLIRIAWMWRFLSRTRWTVYTCSSLWIQREFPVEMALLDAEQTMYTVCIRSSRRTEILRGMSRPEVWFAGDAGRRGILTVAGGGEMFRARMRPVRPISLIYRTTGVPPRPSNTTWERRVADMDPVQREKLRARREARRAKNAADEVREPKLPRIRGARRLRFK